MIFVDMTIAQDLHIVTVEESTCIKYEYDWYIIKVKYPSIVLRELLLWFPILYINHVSHWKNSGPILKGVVTLPCVKFLFVRVCIHPTLMVQFLSDLGFQLLEATIFHWHFVMKEYLFGTLFSYNFFLAKVSLASNSFKWVRHNNMH